MPFQVSQNLAKIDCLLPKLPNDIEKVIGVSNLLLIDIISNIGAFVYELYQKGTNLFKGFSKDFKFEKTKCSNKIKNIIYEKLFKLDLFSEESIKIDREKKHVIEFETIIGKLNIVLIETFVHIKVFFEILIQRLSQKGFLKALKITAIKFSYISKIKIYNWWRDIKEPIFKVEIKNNDYKEKVKIEPFNEAVFKANLNDEDKKYIIEKKDIEKLIEDEIKKKEQDDINEYKTRIAREEKIVKKIFKVAFLGYVVFLLYIYISNKYNSEYISPKPTMFYFENNIPKCFEVTFETVKGLFSNDLFRSLKEVPISNCRRDWCFNYQTLKRFRKVCMQDENCPVYIWDEAMKYAK